MVINRIIEQSIFETYSKASHCFILGCSKETFSYWVWKITDVWVCPKMLRRFMLKLVSQNIFRTYRSARWMGKKGYTCFELKNKGKMLLNKYTK
jgi:hypothetical protein